MVFKSAIIQDTKNVGNETKKIIIVDIEKLSKRDIDYILENFAQIFEGRNTSRSTRIAAKYFLDNYESKSIDQQHGLVAELILTCILRNKNYGQEHCFKNLEERSVKKGFDGLFSYEDNYWVAESKSTYTVTAHKNNHKETINRAYTGLNNQLSGNTSSNAWENAYTHSQLAGSKESLIKKLEGLSEDYLDKKYLKIEDNSVILGSTVVSEDIKVIEKNLSSIEKYIKKHNAKKELVVIITMSSIDIVIKELKELING